MTKLNRWKMGWALFLLCVATAVAAKAQTFTTLLSFDGSNGKHPYASLVQGIDGNYYGTTVYGGGIHDKGTVFEITAGGKLTKRSFHGDSGGAFPYAGLALGTGGYFYGTTEADRAYGFGIVFKVSPDGTLTTLYSFCPRGYPCSDGWGGRAALVEGRDGNFYGTTEAGGTNDAGTVFKITPSGTLTTLYSFCPQGPPDCSDGRQPFAGLVQGTDGYFYGTTQYGGINNGGTLFKITSRGTVTTLYSFCSQANCTDGEDPGAGLVQATDGNFYGTTESGGSFKCHSGFHTYTGCGTVFEITPGGKLTTLHNFGGADGAFPYAGLVQATNGALYGTTAGGGGAAPGGNTGSLCCGTVFSLDTGLGPFVAFVRSEGRVGQISDILGRKR